MRNTRRLPDGLDGLLLQQSGVVRRDQGLRFAPSGWLDRQVNAGRWQSPHRGIYVAHNGPLTPRQREWVALLGAGRRALLAGSSALAAHGLRGYPPARIHVLIPARRRDLDTPSGAVVHRTTLLPPDDIEDARPPRTTPARSVIDAASWAASDDQARAIVAAAFQQRLVDAGRMWTTLARMRRAKRRGLVLESVGDAAGGSESISEIEFLRLCRRGGLPPPTRQSLVVDHDGRARYRDAYFEEWRVHVEVDGGQHMAVGTWWADMRRQNAMWVAGDRVLRFPAWAIRHDADAVIATIQAALVAAGWQPPTFPSGPSGSW